jgi:hypothetical protein
LRTLFMTADSRQPAHAAYYLQRLWRAGDEVVNGRS